ncbi:MAG: retention module-containing protein, partial [Azovibrio sp.]
MAQVIARVVFVSGEAFIKSSSGRTRPVRAGDELIEGDTIITSAGAEVQLAFDDGRDVVVRGNETLYMDASVASQEKPDVGDSAFLSRNGEVIKVVDALNQGGDLDEVIEDPAAGPSGGGDSLHSFVRLARIVETLEGHRVFNFYNPEDVTDDRSALAGQQDYSLGLPQQGNGSGGGNGLSVNIGQGSGGIQVSESGLPGGTSAGMGAQSGWLLLNLPAGVTPDVGVFAGQYGTFEVRDGGNSTYFYQYTLTRPVSDRPGVDDGRQVVEDADVLKLVIRDAGGNTGYANIMVDIVDDVPVARNDGDYVVSIGGTTFGNVVGNDLLGADGPAAGGPVVSVTVNGNTYSVGAGGTSVVGKYGVLTINPDGSYSYTRKGLMGSNDVDQFTYTIRDADGDAANAQLNIASHDGSGPGPGAGSFVIDTSSGGVLVSEQYLGTGTTPNSSQLTQPGNIVVDSKGQSFGVTLTGQGGATLSLTFNPDGTLASGAGSKLLTASGEVTITGSSIDPSGKVTINYNYTLSSTVTHSGAGQDTLASGDSFGISVTDSEGGSKTGSVDVAIRDDAPFALGDSNYAETAGLPITGNLMSNDRIGADGPVSGGPVVSVTFNGIPYTVEPTGTTIPGSFGSLTVYPSGAYSYTRSGPMTASDSDVFSYTIQDKDGDQASASLTITRGSGGSTGGIDTFEINTTAGGVAVSEQNLAEGTSPDAGLLTRLGSFVIDPKGENFTLSLTGKDGIPVVLSLNVDGSLASGGSFDTEVGTVTITGSSRDASGKVTVTYEYTLKDSTTHSGAGNDEKADGDHFSLTVTDAVNVSKTVDVNVSVKDDAPIAANDKDFAEHLGDVATGNVIDNDKVGADGPAVGGAVVSVAINGNDKALDAAGETIEGKFGS